MSGLGGPLRRNAQPAVREAIELSILSVDEDKVRILGIPRPHVLAWRQSGVTDRTGLAPILRWQSPAVRVERVGNDYRLALDVYCSNEGPAESNARIQSFDAELRGWGHLDFDEVQRGTTVYSVHSNFANRFLLKIRQPSTGAFSYGRQTISWSVVYTDDALHPYLTSASVDIDVNGIGPAQVISQALDETTSQQRFDRYARGAPDRLSGWSTGFQS